MIRFHSIIYPTLLIAYICTREAFLVAARRAWNEICHVDGRERESKCVTHNNKNSKILTKLFTMQASCKLNKKASKWSVLVLRNNGNEKNLLCWLLASLQSDWKRDMSRHTNANWKNHWKPMFSEKVAKIYRRILLCCFKNSNKTDFVFGLPGEPDSPWGPARPEI